jgi:hypothetical protein
MEPGTRRREFALRKSFRDGRRGWYGVPWLARGTETMVERGARIGFGRWVRLREL